MVDSKPQVVVIAGPNGAGKTTAAQTLLRGTLKVPTFVNADWIARGLSAFDPDSVALEAGRIMLHRLKQLAEVRASFAFETTLASRTFAPWIRELCDSGYRFALLYLWLPDPTQSVLRVAQRVSQGGHGVPDDTVRRRYAAGLRNFFQLYQPLTNRWRFYDNSLGNGPKILARGRGIMESAVYDAEKWAAIKEAYKP
ncbi:MAG TPA: AAA family ATPase [Pirellulales bacterium]|nr:AAA family ATPase [Pirellulales bacterium]